MKQVFKRDVRNAVVSTDQNGNRKPTETWAKDTSVTVVSVHANGHIYRPVMVRYKSDNSNAATGCATGIRSGILEFGESVYPGFNSLEFEGIRKEAGLNAFTCGKIDRSIRLYGRLYSQKLQVISTVRFRF